MGKERIDVPIIVPIAIILFASFAAGYVGYAKGKQAGNANAFERCQQACARYIDANLGDCAAQSTEGGASSPVSGYHHDFREYSLSDVYRKLSDIETNQILDKILYPR